jgi:geranylgeranyl reductase family protein
MHSLKIEAGLFLVWGDKHNNTGCDIILSAQMHIQEREHPLYDAIVVGGGPVGSYIARGLAYRGHRVGVLEKSSVWNKRVCCTGIISKKCYQFFLNDKDIVLQNGRSAKVYSPSGKLLHLNHKEDQAYIINRTALDFTMAGDAIAAGSEYLQNCTVKRFGYGKDCVQIEYAKDGASLKAEAKMAIIASGFGSRKLEEIKLGASDNYTIGAQIEVQHRDVDEIEIYTGKQIAPGFFGWLVPVNSKQALVGLMSRQNPNRYLKEFLTLLGEREKIADASRIAPAYRGITLHPPKRTYGERFIVAGDAAGQVKPLTGGGIYFGLICADVAINNVDKALNEGDFRADKLSAYEKEWKSILNRELKICRFAHRIYGGLSDRQLNRIFNMVVDSGIIRELLESDELDFDFHSRLIRKALGFRTVSKLFSREKA